MNQFSRIVHYAEHQVLNSCVLLILYGNSNWSLYCMMAKSKNNIFIVISNMSHSSWTVQSFSLLYSTKLWPERASSFGFGGPWGGIFPWALKNFYSRTAIFEFYGVLTPMVSIHFKWESNKIQMYFLYGPVNLFHRVSTFLVMKSFKWKWSNPMGFPKHFFSPNWL